MTCGENVALMKNGKLSDAVRDIDIEGNKGRMDGIIGLDRRYLVGCMNDNEMHMIGVGLLNHEN